MNDIFHAKSTDKPTIYKILEYRIFQIDLPNMNIRMSHHIFLNSVKEISIIPEQVDN